MSVSIGSDRAALALDAAPRARRPVLAATTRLVQRYPLGAVCSVLLALVLFAAVFAPLLSPYDPERSIRNAVLLAPGARHWLGTDYLGRDILSRLIWGSRISLFIATAVSLFGTIPGVLIGLISGYGGAKTDLIIQRFVDALSAFPGLILALLFMIVFGQSILNVIVALVVVSNPRVIRTVRSVVLSVKQRDYVLASEAMGAGSWRVMLFHILPNCLAPIIILVSAGFGTVIIVESSLDFLGFGIPPNVPTWGSMLGGQAQQYVLSDPWIAVIPGAVLSITVLAMNLLGDALRDGLDPRLRGS